MLPTTIKGKETGGNQEVQQELERWWENAKKGRSRSDGRRVETWDRKPSLVGFGVVLVVGGFWLGIVALEADRAQNPNGSSGGFGNLTRYGTMVKAVRFDMTRTIYGKAKKPQ